MNQRFDSAGHLMSLLGVMLLAVASLVTGQVLEPSEIVANEGENATMTCDIISIPPGTPIIQVQVGESEFMDVVNVYPNRLVTDDMNDPIRFIILDVNRTEDGIEFRCRYGSTIVSNIGTLDVRFAPQYTDPDDQVAEEGNDFSLSIVLDPGDPEEDAFQWQFDNQNISNDTRITLTRDSIMITNVTQSDDGNYSVTTYNEVGPTTVEFSLDVQFPPQYTEDPDDQVVREGDDFSLSIALDPGDPEAVNFQWQFNDNNISSDARIALTRESIMITDVQRSDGGTYSVTTYNEVGATTVEFNLDIQSPPVFTVDGTCDSVVNENRMEGTDFTLNCTVFGNPIPELTTTQPPTSSATFNTSTQQFSFTSATPQDSGNYTCNAANTVAGEEETCIRTYVVTVGPLPPPVSAIEVNFDDNNVVISWSFESNDDFPTQFFLVVITDGAGNQVFSENVTAPSGNVASTSVDIESELEFNTDYTVAVIATNDVGSSTETATFTTPETMTMPGKTVGLSTSLLTTVVMMLVAFTF